MKTSGATTPRSPRPHPRAAFAVATVLALSFSPGRVGGWGPEAEAEPAIRHQPPGCVIAEKYPRLSACFQPGSELARGRVYFRQAGSEDWYYVEMVGPPPCLEAVLPRPRKGIEAIEYYVSGMDRQLVERRTAVYTTEVTTSEGCGEESVAPVVDEPVSVVIGAPSGSAPPGFLTGEGVSPGLILGVVGGGVAVAALALALAQDDEGEGAPRPSTTGTVAPLVSELTVPGGRGWITVDGQRLGVGLGSTVQPVRLLPGVHRVEGALVEARGEPGVWRFDLTHVPLAPGSLHVVAGEVAEIGAAQIGFSMSAQPGERVGFAFRARAR